MEKITLKSGDLIRLFHPSSDMYLHSEDSKYIHKKSSKKQILVTSKGQDNQSEFTNFYMHKCSKDALQERSIQSKSRELIGISPETKGQTVQNGDIIILVHEKTKKNISELQGAISPLSQESEVCCMGYNEKDQDNRNNDKFIIILTDSIKIDQAQNMCKINLVSINSKKLQYLSSHPVQFSQGLNETFLSSVKNKNNLWIIQKVQEENPKKLEIKQMDDQISTNTTEQLTQETKDQISTKTTEQLTSESKNQIYINTTNITEQMTVETMDQISKNTTEQLTEETKDQISTNTSDQLSWKTKDCDNVQSLPIQHLQQLNQPQIIVKEEKDIQYPRVFNKYNIKLRHLMTSRILKCWEFNYKKKNNEKKDEKEIVASDIRDLNDWWKIEILFLGVDQAQKQNYQFQNQISNGDLVRFIHVKTNKVLTAYKDFLSKTTKLPLVMGEESKGETNCNGIFKVFILDSIDGTLKQNHIVYFQHLLTGQWLQSTREKSQNSNDEWEDLSFYTQEITLSTEQDENNYFAIEDIQQQKI